MDSDAVDALLERYLALLDEYSTLRTRLSQLQTSMFQHLARANFSAERGMRYGPDFYDERMQALRQVSISTTEGRLPIFSVSHSSRPEGGGDGDGVTSRQQRQDPQPAHHPSAEEDWREAAAGVPVGEQPVPAGSEAGPKKQNARDPLRWFGVLTPLSLRQTQACAAEAVDQVIPRLASLSAEMQDLEIQVRRARKKRAKERTAAARQLHKQQQQQQQQQSVMGEQLAAK
jgi:coiled-coil domain-containing protein 115